MALPPTSSKLSSDSNNVTTFNYQFPNFTGTHTGTTVALGINSVAGGGTGFGTATTGDIIYASATNTFSKLPIGSSGNALTVSVGGLPAWGTLSPSFSGLTNNAPVIANSTSTITTTTVGSTGQVFASNGGTSPPGWLTLSGTASFASFTSSIVNTQSSVITTSTFATFSNSPSFTVTPTITGTYKVYSSIPVAQSTGAAVGAYRIFNTSGGATLLAESQGTGYNTVNPGSWSVYAQSVYTLTAGSTYVFDIQGADVSLTTAGVLDRGDDAPFYMFCEGVGLPGGSVTGVTRSVSSISSNTSAGSATSTDYVYLASSSAIITLPTAASNTNLYTIKNVDGSTITINTTSSQTMDGSTSITLTPQYQSLSFISNGSNWSIV